MACFRCLAESHNSVGGNPLAVLRAIFDRMRSVRCWPAWVSGEVCLREPDEITMSGGMSEGETGYGAAPSSSLPYGTGAPVCTSCALHGQISRR